jgi:hypothetical protein
LVNGAYALDFPTGIAIWDPPKDTSLILTYNVFFAQA